LPLCADIRADPKSSASARHRQRQKAELDSSTQGLEYPRIEDETVVDFLRRADVVIADSQYDAMEYPSRRGSGHTFADDPIQLAARARARQLFLFASWSRSRRCKNCRDGCARRKEGGEDRFELRVGAAAERAEIKLTH
jgi:hypothetical protein